MIRQRSIRCSLQFETEKNDDTRLAIVRAVAAVPSPKSQAFLTTILEGKHPEAMGLEAIAGLEKFPPQRLMC